jgi:MOSC domain-containing protein YiiM
MAAVSAQVVSVNVGQPQQIGTQRGEPLISAIGKQPVEGRVRVAGVNVAGDVQVNLAVHGGADQAVYAYAAEDAAWWAAQLGREVPPGIFGENLTTAGLEQSGALIGERWQVGGVLLEVSAPRIPCAKLGRAFGDGRMVKRFAQALRPGAYLRIVEEGELGAGDPITVVSRPDHDITVRFVAEAILHDKALVARLLEAPQLPERLLSWVREQAA